MQLDLFKEICFLPLDIPPLPDKSDICNQFDQLTSERYIWWNREILLGKKDYEHPIGSYDCTWSDIARSQFSQIIESIETSLPFENLYYCHLARAQEEILPHVDENYIEKPFVLFDKGFFIQYN